MRSVLQVSVILLFSFFAMAGLPPNKNKKKEMYFSEQLVNGKFQLPGDNAVEVENEKPVFNLLKIRSDFKDRRLKETTRD